RQRLDRGPDGGLDHPRHDARRTADPRARVGRAARVRRAVHRHRDRHAGGGRDRDHRGGLRHRRPLQPRSAQDRRGAEEAAGRSARDAEGLRALRRAPVARPPRPDLARGHHALLGRGRDAAVHRHRVGASGAGLASLWVALDRSVRVIPMGIAMGLIVIAMNLVQQAWLAMVLMVLIGALAGFFVVPMNALLQHRGHHLVGAGRSIAVQNFNENSSILVMIALYSWLLNVGYSIYFVIVVFGGFVAGAMTLVQLWYLRNHRVHRDEIERLLAFARAEDPHKA